MKKNHKPMYAAAITALTLTLSSAAFSDEYSKTFTEAHGKTIQSWGAKYDSASEIDCEDSRIATIKDGTSSVHRACDWPRSKFKAKSGCTVGLTTCAR